MISPLRQEVWEDQVWDSWIPGRGEDDWIWGRLVLVDTAVCPNELESGKHVSNLVLTPQC